MTENHPCTSGLSFPLPAACEMQPGFFFFFDIHSDIIKQHQESGTQEEVVILSRGRLTPPRLLICYSSYDGPAHVKAVMQLGAFIQQHMATQVVDMTYKGVICHRHFVHIEQFQFYRPFLQQFAKCASDSVVHFFFLLLLLF